MPTPGTDDAVIGPIPVHMPFASRRQVLKIVWSAVAVSIRLAAFGSRLIAGPLYCHWNEEGEPADEDESAMLLAMADTYFEKLAVIDQSPLPFGSHTTPSRGLNALSFAVRLPIASLPWFLS